MQYTWVVSEWVISSVVPNHMLQFRFSFLNRLFLFVFFYFLNCKLLTDNKGIIFIKNKPNTMFTPD